MRTRSKGSVALVATMALAVLCCADRSGSRNVDVEPTAVGWGAESVAWTQQLFEFVDAHGGLGAIPFLAPDVVIDQRTFLGPVGYREGLDAAVALLDRFNGGLDPATARWGYSDAPYLDPRGVVIAAEVMVGPDPHHASLHRHGAVLMDIGRDGIERQTVIPSTRLWVELDQRRRSDPAGGARRMGARALRLRRAPPAGHPERDVHVDECLLQ